jgi:hypothetical protein
VIWGKHINEADYAALIASMATGTVGAYFALLLEEMARKFGENLVREVLRNWGQTIIHGNCEFHAGIATYKYWHIIFNPFRGRHERVATKPNTHQPYVKFRCGELGGNEPDSPDPSIPPDARLPKYNSLPAILHGFQ